MQSRSAFFTVSLDKLTLLFSWIKDGRAETPIRRVVPTTRNSLKWYFLLLRELLKHQNFRIASQM